MSSIHRSHLILPCVLTETLVLHVKLITCPALAEDHKYAFHIELFQGSIMILTVKYSILDYDYVHYNVDGLLILTLSEVQPI